jgi:hypothetical protein
LRHSPLSSLKTHQSQHQPHIHIQHTRARSLSVTFSPRSPHTLSVSAHPPFVPPTPF